MFTRPCFPLAFPIYLLPLLSPETPEFSHKLSAALLPQVLKVSPSNKHSRTRAEDGCWVLFCHFWAEQWGAATWDLGLAPLLAASAVSHLCSCLPSPIGKWELQRDLLGLLVLRICCPGERSCKDAD